MTDRLFDLPEPVKLTDRQQRAHDLIQAAGWDGLRTDELGAALHHPKHGLNERCDWCSSAGTAAGAALRRKGLVRQRRRKDANGHVYSVWTTVDARAPVREFGLPEGY